MQKFNFYDIYGYLLPGLTLLSLAWLPFVLVRTSWPHLGLSGAAAMVVFGYILGHPLQNISRHVLSPKVRDGSGAEARYPSELVLDNENTSLDAGLKKWLGKYASEKLDLDLSIDSGRKDWSEDVSRRRQSAFFVARAALISRGVAGYAEQFEGMYSMMRGLTGAFALGGFYCAGWILSYWMSPCARRAAPLAAILGLVLATAASCAAGAGGETKRSLFLDQVTSWAVVAALVASGYSLGAWHGHSRALLMELGALFLSCLFLARRSYLAYQFFAMQFALTVWRDFAAHMRATVS